MASTWNWLWLTVAFVSELAALAALGHWGWVTGSGAVRLLLAIGTPAVAAVLWGVFAAPAAPVQVVVLATLVKVLVFGSAAAALAATGHPRLALVLGAAAAASALLSTPPVMTAPVTG
jgi:hypothetical protein